MKPTTQLGPVMLDLRDPSLDAEERDWLRHPAVGGLIFFTRNYENPQQLAGLVQAIRAVRPGLLLAVDHEGGRVQRFRQGFTRLPPASAFAGQLEGEELTDTLKTAGWLMAAELRAVGIDFSFAPVLDVDAGISQIIGDRSYSRDAAQAAACALAFAEGMRTAGMAAVGKHFPGHGAVAADSHLTLPEDDRSYQEIEARDLLPFQTLIAHGLEGIMPAHIIYRQMDSYPAGFSRFWVSDILRRRLGFNGAVFSDDLSMAGAAFAGDYPDRARLALEAGCDMVLVCNHPEAIGAVLESLENRANPDSLARFAALRGRFAIDREELLSSTQWQEAADRINRLTQHAQP